MVVLTAKYQCKAGTADQVESLLREMMSLVQQEQGCIHYLVNRSEDDPDSFLLFEQYEDEAALAKHSETPYFKRIVLDSIVPLLERRERTLYTPLHP
ncbi:putative quinol monooxygenase [Alicyclobacillus ferrooxydans]|uniref:Antibiotic biosynthesis monooxygenase n=1 Tax=Alicyclobacillus ferrooxydans TaxID=471514 RepID=A0A0P9EHR1_9BACL|nr:putative quinol monooxygenase [Alicyclobacillus ferrooxydans]KPV42226.1 antibiotic biosynthesis monooxygenase [Alicyclobacillus ferrooxydans]